MCTQGRPEKSFLFLWRPSHLAFKTQTLYPSVRLDGDGTGIYETLSDRQAHRQTDTGVGGVLSSCAIFGDVNVAFTFAKGGRVNLHHQLSVTGRTRDVKHRGLKTGAPN